MKDEVAKQMQDTLNWAVLGTGVIANEMAQALQKMGNRYMQLETGRMRRQLHLLKNMMFPKYMIRLMICFWMRM